MIWAVNLDQVMIIGEDFEGYIKKFDVNFMPYALTINEKVHKYIYIYLYHCNNFLYIKLHNTSWTFGIPKCNTSPNLAFRYHVYTLHDFQYSLRTIRRAIVLRSI